MACLSELICINALLCTELLFIFVEHIKWDFLQMLLSLSFSVVVPVMVIMLFNFCVMFNGRSHSFVLLLQNYCHSMLLFCLLMIITFFLKKCVIAIIS